MTKESPKQNIIVAVSSMQALWINIGLICYHNKPLSGWFVFHRLNSCFFLRPVREEWKNKKNKEEKKKKYGYMLFYIYWSRFSIS